MEFEYTPCAGDGDYTPWVDEHPTDDHLIDWDNIGCADELAKELEPNKAKYVLYCGECNLSTTEVNATHCEKCGSKFQRKPIEIHTEEIYDPSLDECNEG